MCQFSISPGINTGELAECFLRSGSVKAFSSDTEDMETKEALILKCALFKKEAS